MIPHYTRRVVKARLYVTTGEFRIFFQDILNGVARSQKLQDRLHRNASAFDNRFSVTEIRSNNYSTTHIPNVSLCVAGVSNSAAEPQFSDISHRVTEFKI